MVDHADYIIIGSGIAGLRACLELANAGRVVVFTKEEVTESNTEYAQGGVAAVISDDDDIALHFEDTINAGAGLCEKEAVRVLVEEGPRAIEELIEWGAEFDRTGDRLELGQEAAHSRRRILHAKGDSTGREIVRAMLAQLYRLNKVELIQHALSVELVTREGRCIGVGFIDTITGIYHRVFSRAVILTTGGAGQLYAHSTNPDVATGDGMAMAYYAGAVLADMEFVQFHPTALSVPGAPNFLLSEAMRGEGALLRNVHREWFMSAYHERAELAPRDVVSRAIIQEMARTQSDVVFLDVTHLNAERIKARFPRIYTTCLQYGIDITRELIPVSPAAHYMMGGVRTDLHGRTCVTGLYAAGEVACAGIHGANRLASNSLLEGLVFGARAARAVLADALPAPAVATVDKKEPWPADWRIEPEVFHQVRTLMSRHVSIIRSADELAQAVEKLASYEKRATNLPTRNFVTVARLVATAALLRQESRGAHYRSDFPERDDNRWLVHSAQRLGVEPYTIPVGQAD
ncbi:MAG: L-aspartate oxidase [Acidobacteriota bacterium]|nr:L-aspartate oxidase [Blastocatellia bacterium]MDW8241045.1 L-aspartate oxidase [Acidobacteriota bacterium]